MAFIHMMAPFFIAENKAERILEAAEESCLFSRKYTGLGLNPITGKEETAQRRTLKIDDELPLHEEYSNFIAKLLKV